MENRKRNIRLRFNLTDKEKNYLKGKRRKRSKKYEPFYTKNGFGKGNL